MFYYWYAGKQNHTFCLLLTDEVVITFRVIHLFSLISHSSSFISVSWFNCPPPLWEFIWPWQICRCISHIPLKNCWGREKALTMNRRCSRSSFLLSSLIKNKVTIIFVCHTFVRISEIFFNYRTYTLLAQAFFSSYSRERERESLCLPVCLSFRPHWGYTGERA